MDRDLAGGAAALGWASTSLQEAAVYIADAPHRRLPLLGPEDSHDWWQLLGSHGWLGAAGSRHGHSSRSGTSSWSVTSVTAGSS